MMIRFLIRVLSLFMFLVIAISCNDNVVDKEEWIELFNGVDLNDWDIKIAGFELNENYGNTFRAEEGLLKVRYDQYESYDGQIGHIFYKEPFSHYRLIVEYRFVGEQLAGAPVWVFRNNGIMLHSQSAESMELYQWFPTSVEMQLLGGEGEEDRPNGNIFTPGTRVVIDNELRGTGKN